MPLINICFPFKQYYDSETQLKMQTNYSRFETNPDLIAKNGVYARNQRPQIYKGRLFFFLKFFMTQNLSDSAISLVILLDLRMG